MRKSYLFIISIYSALLKLLFIIKNVHNIPPGLNNIVKLSDDNFIYNHISINSKGDMIIDTSSAESGERKFYGIKKNGTPYFGTSNYKSITVKRENDLGRSEGEALFIKYRKNQDYSETGECLVYIPIKGNKYMEYYFFEDDIIVNATIYSTIFGNIKSKRFSALKFQPDNDANLDYIFCYKNGSDLVISIGNFYNSNEYSYNQNSFIIADKTGGDKERMVSCFFTKKKIYICFFYYSSAYNRLSFLFPINDNNKNISEICKINGNTNNYINIFYKAIHVKSEIGAFIYFEKYDAGFPQIQFKRIDQLSLIDIFGPINISQFTFCKEEFLNDFIKLNDDQVCYISTNPDKQILYIVLLTLYNSDSDYWIKYFLQNIKDEYKNVLYEQIIANIYNSFITVAFSQCVPSKTNCSSSFFIIGYPNSTDSTIDIIQKIKEEKKSIDELCFYLNDSLFIDNNIFNYTFNGTQIIDYSEEIKLLVEDNQIEKNYILGGDECLKVDFPNKNGLFRKNTYKIEFAYIVKESLNETPVNYDEKTFKGKHSNFSYEINYDIWLIYLNMIKSLFIYHFFKSQI